MTEATDKQKAFIQKHNLVPLEILNQLDTKSASVLISAKIEDMNKDNPVDTVKPGFAPTMAIAPAKTWNERKSVKGTAYEKDPVGLAVEVFCAVINHPALAEQEKMVTMQTCIDVVKQAQEAFSD